MSPPPPQCRSDRTIWIYSKVLGGRGRKAYVAKRVCQNDDIRKRMADTMSCLCLWPASYIPRLIRWAVRTLWSQITFCHTSFFKGLMSVNRHRVLVADVVLYGTDHTDVLDVWGVFVSVCDRELSLGRTTYFAKFAF